MANTLMHCFHQIFGEYQLRKSNAGRYRGWDTDRIEHCGQTSAHAQIEPSIGEFIERFQMAIGSHYKTMVCPCSVVGSDCHEEVYGASKYLDCLMLSLKQYFKTPDCQKTEDTSKNKEQLPSFT